MVWGDPTYANDHLVMKWSKAWDDARFHGEPWGQFEVIFSQGIAAGEHSWETHALPSGYGPK